MKLLSSPTSPFVRKIRVMIIEADKSAGIELLEVATTPLATSPDVAAANPIGKIPALLRQDGPAIYDSRVIARYLDDLWQTEFYPKSRLWELLTLEATADAICDSAVSMAYEVKFRSPEMQMPDWLEAQWAKIARALDVIEARWMSHLAGPLDAAQIAVGCALEYLDLRHEGRDWRASRPVLAAWQAAFAQRSAMLATVPQ
ncbi:MAG: glutathione S-transferase [Rhodobacteraceae bacterium]|nr:glutathione S-transferase [Paracoccaceae bacterium]